ncbi:MAG: C10 family peptidase [Crocinitomicaceae bacterium]|nr:C10 family peptidase [Crocinitomicaceae bacterium]
MKTLILTCVLLISSSINAQVSPLLSTTWNQTCYYNALVPTFGSGGSCGNAYTGCNSTAMAQICKYYAYPTTGFGSHCNSNFPSECADFSAANYNYAAMPNAVSSANLEVATLMYDLGVSVDMSWSGTNSTSFFSSKVLKKHFAYSPKMYSTAIFLFGSTAELIAGIKAELDEGRPVYAKGGGHFYLIDGYNSSDEFHMNFGWGGTYDGYFPIDAVTNPAGTFNPSNFIFNITPMVDDLETAVDTLFISASGSTTAEIEFTSLSNWTMTSSESWITPALTSGTEGYYDFSGGCTATIPVNNGALRTGYIIISNATETDTIVVVQDPSELTVTPCPINFLETGGSETVSVSYYSWGNWTASVSEPWLSLSSSSGTGSDSFTLTCSANSGAARTAQLIVDGGTFVDTVVVTQDGSTSSLEDLIQSQVIVFPNPTDGICTIHNLNSNKEVLIQDLHGSLIKTIDSINNEVIVDLTDYPAGVYFIRFEDEVIRLMKN